MDLRQLEYVVAVVDAGTFTKAASTVHVTQPSLSQGIRALERELGVDLFHRVGRRAVLSAAGEAFLAPARQTLRDADIARQAATSVSEVASGRLDIATLSSLAVEPLATWIGAFRVAYPGVRVRVVEPEDADSITQLVRGGSCEVAIAGLPAPSDLEVVPLGDQMIVAVTPASASWPASGKVALSRLARFPLVCTPVGTSTRDLVEAAFASVGVEPDVRVETTHREALIPLVVAGAGITFLARSLAEDAGGRGANVVTPEPAIRRHVGLVYRRGPLSPAAAAFLDIVARERDTLRRKRDKARPRRS